MPEPGYVPPEINVPREGAVLVVGRDPGDKETEDGRPFVGPAGEHLDLVLAQSGLRRRDCNIANTVGYQPPDNLFKEHDERRVEEGVAEVRSLARQLKPSLIITLGNEAAHTFVPDWPTNGRGIFGAKNIEERRGYFWDTPYGMTLTALHPAGVLRKMVPGDYLLKHDFRRARKYLQGKLPRDEFPEVKRLDRQAYVDRLRQSRLLAWDIETKWNMTALWMCGFCGDDLQPYVSLYPYEFNLYGKQLLLAGVPNVGHNRLFDDAAMLLFEGIDVKGQKEDTQQMWHCVAGGEPVQTLTGPKPIQDIRPGEWILGWKNGAPVPAQTSGARLTQRSAPLIRITYLKRALKTNVRKKQLSPSDYAAYRPQAILCTPEHRFLVSDGTWKEAQHLRTGDSLVSMSFSTTRGRRQVTWNRRTQKLAHRVWEALHGSIPLGHHIHHQNGNPSDDRPENLACLSSVDHRRLHAPTAVPGQGKAGQRVHERAARKYAPRTVAQFYRAGLSIAEVCRETGLAEGTVRRWLRQEHVTPRTLAEAQQLRRVKKRNARVLSVEWLDKRDDVFCMSVPDTDNFVLRDLVSHNSLEPELAGRDEEDEDSVDGKKRGRMTRKGLAFLMTIYDFNVRFWKLYPVDREDDEARDQMIELNGRDAWSTRVLASCMLPELESKDVMAQYTLGTGTYRSLLRMALRGLPIDEELRQQRLSALEERFERLKAQAAEPMRKYILDHNLRFYFRKVKCPCCGGGKIQAQHCWKCTSFPKKPEGKLEWLDFARDSGLLDDLDWSKVRGKLPTVKQLQSLLAPCTTCSGTGRVDAFKPGRPNPFSEQQLKQFLHNDLAAPKSVFRGKTITDAAALKKVLRWAKGE